MNDYLSTAKDYARLAEDAKGKRNRDRFATLAVMYAGMANAVSMKGTLEVQQEMADVSRKHIESTERQHFLYGEAKVLYSDDREPVLMDLQQASDIVEEVESGKRADIVFVEFRHYTAYTQMYPKNISIGD